MSTTGPVAGTAARRARRDAERSATTGRRRVPGDPSPQRGDERGDVPAPSTQPARRLDPDELAALEDERDFLLRSLQDLEREHDAGDVDDVDYDALRDGYTARAAEVLRAIESRHAAMASSRPPSGPGRRTVIAAIVALLAIVAGVAVAQASGRRGAGDEITGDIRQSVRDTILAAQRAMAEDRPLEALELYNTAIEASPSNVEAHTYKGWLLTLTARQSPAGDDQNLLRARALESLDRAVELDPTYGDARVFRASLYSDLGQPAAGLADLDRLSPGDIPEYMGPMVDSLRQRLTGEAGAAPPG